MTRTYKLLSERLSRDQVDATIDFIVLLPIGLDKPVTFSGTKITVMVMPYPVDPSQLSKTLQQMFARRTELGKCCGEGEGRVGGLFMYVLFILFIQPVEVVEALFDRVWETDL